MSRSRLLTGVAAFLVCFIYLPLVVVVIYSVNSKSNLSWPPRGVSLRWFRLIFGDEAFLSGLKASATAAFATALVAGAVGTTAAFAFARRPSRLSSALESGSRIPVMLPPLFIGIALGAAYLLWLYQRVMFGPVTQFANEDLPDLNLREYATLVPLVILAFWIGIYPKPLFTILEQPVKQLQEHAASLRETSVASAGSATVAVNEKSAPVSKGGSM